jgi:threonine/homoserine efflux transporter RhtA
MRFVVMFANVPSQKRVSRNFNWIWYLGAAVWFLNAALAMRHSNLRVGMTNALIAAVFLAAGIFFGRQAKRPSGRGNGHRRWSEGLPLIVPYGRQHTNNEQGSPIA